MVLPLNRGEESRVLTPSAPMALIKESLYLIPMKLSILKKSLFGLGALILASYCCSCGNTLYGFGLDMERSGRRLQTNHDPNAADYQQGGYTPPQTQQPAYQPNYGY